MPDYLTARAPRLPAVERICETCGAGFFAKAAKVRLGGGKFCSRACFGATKGAPAVTKTCPVCGKVFQTWQCLDSTFCSLPCKYEGTSLVAPVPCQHCGAMFKPRSVGRIDRLEGIRHLFCSRPCYDDFRTSADGLNDRFFAKVRKSLICWPWIGNRRREYGEFWKQNVRMPAHHYAWEMVAGPIPDGLLVLHDCPGGDNPLCVRNDTEGIHVINGIVRPQWGHLWIGTQAENMADMQLKGRSPVAKISPEQAREIKTWLADGIGVTEIARMYSLSRSAVMSIQRGNSWKYV